MGLTPCSDFILDTDRRGRAAFLGLGHPRFPAQRDSPGRRAAGSGLSFSNRLPSLSVKPPMSRSHGALSNSAELIWATPASNVRVWGANEAGTPLCPDHSLGQGGLGHSNCYDLAVWGSEMYLQPHKPSASCWSWLDVTEPVGSN